MGADEIEWDPIYRREDYSQFVNPRAGCALEYFLDANGKCLTSSLGEGLQRARDSGRPLQMRSPGQVKQLLKGGLLLVVVGVACSALLFWLIPQWELGSLIPDPRYNRGRGFPVWSLTAGLLGMGYGLIIVAGLGALDASVFQRPAVSAVILLFGMLVCFVLAVRIAWMV